MYDMISVLTISDNPSLKIKQLAQRMLLGKKMINKLSQILKNNDLADTKEKDINKKDCWCVVESWRMDTSVLVSCIIAWLRQGQNMDLEVRIYI